MPTPNDAGQAQLYDGTLVTNDYFLASGVCVLPFAETPPTTVAELEDYSPVVTAQLHAPYRIRKLDSSSSKQNNPPVMPTPQSAGAFVFLGGSISFATHVNTTFWNFDWAAQSSYYFVETCVSRPQDGFVLGSVMPYTTLPDQSAVQQYGSTGPVVGAVSQSGPNAVAGFNYGQTIVGLPPSSQDTFTGSSQSQSGQYVSQGLVQAWSYNMVAFYPGTLFNDQLINGGGV